MATAAVELDPEIEALLSHPPEDGGERPGVLGATSMKPAGDRDDLDALGEGPGRPSRSSALQGRAEEDQLGRGVRRAARLECRKGHDQVPECVGPQHGDPRDVRDERACCQAQEGDGRSHGSVFPRAAGTTPHAVTEGGSTRHGGRLGGGQTSSTAFTSLASESLASPKSRVVFGSKSSSFSIPANPGRIDRFMKTICCASSALRIGMP